MSERIKIGDTTLVVNAVNFEIIEQYQSEDISTLRTFGDIVVPLPGKLLSISLSFEFASAYEINYKLRRLYAMFLRFPILRIESQWLKNLVIDSLDEEIAKRGLDADSKEEYKKIIEKAGSNITWVSPLTFTATFTGPRSINVQMNITPVDIEGVGIEPLYLAKNEDVVAQTNFLDKILSLKESTARDLLKQKKGVIFNDDEDQMYFENIFKQIKQDYNDSVGSITSYVEDPSLSEPYKMWYEYLLEGSSGREKWLSYFPSTYYPVLAEWKPSDSIKSQIYIDYPVLKVSEDEFKKQIRSKLQKSIDDLSNFVSDTGVITWEESKKQRIFKTLKGIVKTLLDFKTYTAGYQGQAIGNIKISVGKFIGNTAFLTLLEKLKVIPEIQLGPVLDATNPTVKINSNVYEGESAYQKLSDVILDILERNKDNKEIIKSIYVAVFSTLQEVLSQYNFLIKNFDYERLSIVPTSAVPVSITISASNKLRMLKLLGKDSSVPQFFGTASPIIKIQVRTQDSGFIEDLKRMRMRSQAALMMQRRFSYFLSFLKYLRLDMKISTPDNIFRVFGINNVVLTDLSFHPDPDQAATTIIDIGLIQSDLGRNMYEVYNLNKIVLTPKMRRFFAYMWASALHEFLEYSDCYKKKELMDPLEIIELYKDYLPYKVDVSDFMGGGDSVSIERVIYILRTLGENGIDLWEELMKNDEMTRVKIGTKDNSGNNDMKENTESGGVYRVVHKWNMDLENNGNSVPVIINPIEGEESSVPSLPLAGSEFAHVIISAMLYALEELCKHTDESDFKVILSIIAYQTLFDIYFRSSGMSPVISNKIISKEAEKTEKEAKEVSQLYEGKLNPKLLPDANDPVWRNMVACMEDKIRKEVVPLGGRGRYPSLLASNSEHVRRMSDYLPRLMDIYNKICGDNNIHKFLWFVSLGITETGLQTTEGNNKWDCGGLYQVADETYEWLVGDEEKRKLIEKATEKKLMKNGKIDMSMKFDDDVSAAAGLILYNDSYEVYRMSKYTRGKILNEIMSPDEKDKDRLYYAFAAIDYNRGPGKAKSQLKGMKSEKEDTGKYLTYEGVLDYLDGIPANEKETSNYIRKNVIQVSCMLKYLKPYLEQENPEDFYKEYGLDEPIIDYNGPDNNLHKRVVVCASGTTGGDLSELQNELGEIKAHFLILNGKKMAFGIENLEEDGKILSLIDIKKRIDYNSNPDNDDILVMLVGSPDASKTSYMNLDFDNIDDVFGKVFTYKQGEALAYLLYSLQRYNEQG